MPLPRFGFVALAQSMPPECLLKVFQEVAYDETALEWGGSEEGEDWGSSKGVASCALVCRAWYTPAQTVLLHSVELLNADAATSFLSCLELHPRRANCVQNLVVGLGRSVELSARSKTSPAASLVLVSAIAACTNLRRLHVRPLHAEARPGLLDAVATQSRLSSLVLAPRLRRPTRFWTGPLLFDTDCRSLPTSIRYLEIDAWTHNDVARLHWPAGASQLEVLKLYVEIRSDTLVELLTRTTGLRKLELYTEQWHDPDVVRAGLKHIAATLESLEWKSNVPIEATATSPVFNEDLLGAMVALRHLAVTTSDVVARLLAVLPPNLDSLELVSYVGRDAFDLAEDLVQTLQHTEELKLTRLLIHDSRAVWGDENVELVGEICAMRQVAFQFIDSDLKE